MNITRRLIRMLGGQERKVNQMAVTIPPVPEGVFNPEDLCNQVYNEHQELVNLRWDNPRFHLRLGHILSQTGGKVREWHSQVNPASPAPGGADLRTSTVARIDAYGVYDDFDVRNIFLTPNSVVAMLWELANPGKATPQREPYNFDREADTAVDAADPIGPEWPDHPFAINGGVVTGRKVFHPAPGDKEPIGKVFHREDGDYVKINYWKVPASLSGGGVQAPIWERMKTRKDGVG